MIAIDDVSKRYGGAVVLRNVSAQLEGGQIHGLIGRNGSGKTVLMKCISGLIRATSGTITIDGKVVRGDIEIPDSLGAILDSPGFLPYRSGLSNLMLLARLKKKIGRAEVKQAIARVGLDPNSKKWVCKYSMGMKQRLGIAQAIMEDANLLLLDEPMNGLDKQGVGQMRDLFLDLKARGKTIVLASHSAEDVQTLCDHVYEMDAGVMTQVK